LVGWLVGWVCWLVGWLVGWLIGWLAGWLVGCWLLVVGYWLLLLVVFGKPGLILSQVSSRIRFSFQNKTKALRRAQVTVANLRKSFRLPGTTNLYLTTAGGDEHRR